MLIVTVDQRGNYSSDSGLRLDSKAISFFTFKNIKGQSNQKQYKIRNDKFYYYSGSSNTKLIRIPVIKSMNFTTAHPVECVNRSNLDESEQPLF